MQNQKRVSVFLTRNAWLKAERQAIKNGKKGLQSLIISRIKELDTLFDECPECVKGLNEPKERKIFYLTESAKETLTRISLQIDLPPSSIVTRFIIDPLLVK